MNYFQQEMKSMVTSTSTTVEEKYQVAFKANCFLNFVLISNNRYGIVKLEDKRDRRHAMSYVANTHRASLSNTCTRPSFFSTNFEIHIF